MKGFLQQNNRYRNHSIRSLRQAFLETVRTWLLAPRMDYIYLAFKPMCSAANGPLASCLVREPEHRNELTAIRFTPTVIGPLVLEVDPVRRAVSSACQGLGPRGAEARPLRAVCRAASRMDNIHHTLRLMGSAADRGLSWVPEAPMAGFARLTPSHDPRARSTPTETPVGHTRSAFVSVTVDGKREDAVPQQKARNAYRAGRTLPTRVMILLPLL